MSGVQSESNLGDSPSRSGVQFCDLGPPAAFAPLNRDYPPDVCSEDHANAELYDAAVGFDVGELVECEALSAGIRYECIRHRRSIEE